jgi:hypothetical protein
MWRCDYRRGHRCACTWRKWTLTEKKKTCASWISWNKFYPAVSQTQPVYPDYCVATASEGRNQAQKICPRFSRESDCVGTRKAWSGGSYSNVNFAGFFPPKVAPVCNNHVESNSEKSLGLSKYFHTWAVLHTNTHCLQVWMWKRL